MKTAVWNKIFKDEGRVFHEPHEFMPEVMREMKKAKVKRILDLGCGTGRHLVYLAKNGFQMYGLDGSEQAIEMSKDWLAEKKLQAELTVQEMTALFPYEDHFFDALISTQAMHHGTVKEIKKIISEISRVVRKFGIIFITVPTVKRQAKEYEEIEPRTFVPLDGQEKGLPHHFFTIEELHEFFSDFYILEIKKDKTDHYCLLGRKK